MIVFCCVLPASNKARDDDVTIRLVILYYFFTFSCFVMTNRRHVVAVKHTLRLILLFVIICMTLSFVSFVSTVCFIVIMFSVLRNGYCTISNCLISVAELFIFEWYISQKSHEITCGRRHHHHHQQQQHHKPWAQRPWSLTVLSGSFGFILCRVAHIWYG